MCLEEAEAKGSRMEYELSPLPMHEMKPAGHGYALEKSRALSSWTLILKRPNPGRTLFRPNCVLSSIWFLRRRLPSLLLACGACPPKPIDCSPPVPLLRTKALFSFMSYVRRCQPCAAASPHTITVSAHLANFLLAHDSLYIGPRR